MTLLLFLFFIVLILTGIPVGFSLAIAGTVGLWLTAGLDKVFVTLPTVMYGSLNNFVLIAIPLYILMGNIIIQGKLSDKIYDALNEFVGHLSGGLAIVTVLFCTIFAAISGSSVATAATVGMIVLPEMLRLNYQRKFIFGLTAAGGTLGILIPPSLNFILYGALTDESVGKLFIAGVIPGLILSSFFLIYAIIFSYKKGYRSAHTTDWKKRLRALKAAFFSLLIIPVIMVGIYTGIFNTHRGCRCRLHLCPHRGDGRGKIEVEGLFAVAQGHAQNELYDPDHHRWGHDLRLYRDPAPVPPKRHQVAG